MFLNFLTSGELFYLQCEKIFSKCEELRFNSNVLKQSQEMLNGFLFSHLSCNNFYEYWWIHSNYCRHTINFCKYLYLCPFKVASPELTVVSPASILKVVVLPAPLTPSRPKHSPLWIPKLNPSTAGRLADLP